MVIGYAYHNTRVKTMVIKFFFAFIRGNTKAVFTQNVHWRTSKI